MKIPLIKAARIQADALPSKFPAFPERNEFDLYASPEKLLENVRTSVDRFVKDAEQFDDLTMMCIEYKG